MNRIYRAVFNRAKGLWQVAAEIGSAHGKGKGRARRRVAGATAGALLLIPAQLLAVQLPEGGSVSVGDGTIQRSGDQLVIEQGGEKLAIDWDRFSIGPDGAVRFDQPGVDAKALNRVTGDTISRIRGELTADGGVFLLNPNGVVFGAEAQVNVGSLVASTRGLSNEDFLDGDYTFTGSGSGAVINRGRIEARDGGYVALVGAEIVNTGEIAADQGAVLAGAGDRVTLDLGGPVNIEVEKGTLESRIEQGGVIQADGGRIQMIAEAADELASSAINHDGVSQAQTLETGEDGSIVLKGDMETGTTEVAGTLDASAPDGGDGGFIETSAAEVNIDPEATITTAAPHGETGTWLIDPQDYYIAPSDADTSDITGETLSNNLDSNNVTIESADGGTDGNGDIFVNDTVTWDTNTLTLSAWRNIEINEHLDASGGGSLALLYDQSDSSDGSYTVNFAGGYADTVDPDTDYNGQVSLDSQSSTFTTQKGTDSADQIEYTIITELDNEGSTSGTDLQGMQDDLDGNYVLGADIDASTTAGWNGGEGFDPIQDGGDRFKGTFDGLGHTVSGLTIDRPAESSVGLFGLTSSEASLANLRLTGVDINGNRYVGGLAGSSLSPITNVAVSGMVKGDGDRVGGVAGRSSEIQKSTVTAEVEGTDEVGGVVGYVPYEGIEDVAASGEVEGQNKIGGIVGWHKATDRMINAQASVDVTGVEQVGGVAGEAGYIEDSHATGSVEGDNRVGGLVGSVNGVRFSDATGNVTGNERVGGLAGWASSIQGSHATGRVEGDELVGGLAGEAFVVERSRAEGDVFGKSDVGGLVGNGSRGWLVSSHAKGDVQASGSRVGGLVGTNNFSNGIDDSYATGEVTGGTDVGGLVGTSNSLIKDSHAEGAVQGSGNVGGLVGTSNQWITDSHAEGAVQGSGNIGGLVGIVDAAGSNTKIEHSHATGEVDATGADAAVGGLVGRTVLGSGPDIMTSYATGNVNAGGDGAAVGGLIGSGNWEILGGTYATGDVEATGDQSNIGGLVGLAESSGIQSSYATGSVKASGDESNAGGLVGRIFDHGIYLSYATGKVAADGANSHAGGLVGGGDPTKVFASFWDKQTSGQDTSAGGGTGWTTERMKDPFSFIDEGWDFGSRWGKSSAGNNDGYMVLKDLDDTAYDHYVRLQDTAKTYGDANPAAEDIPKDGDPGADYVDASWGSAIHETTDVGNYAYDDADVLEVDYTQDAPEDYYIHHGRLTIDPRTLTISGDFTAADKVYDGTPDVEISEDNIDLADVIDGDDVSIDPEFQQTAVGSNIEVTLPDSNALSGADSGNYDLDLTDAPTSTAAIDPRPLDVDGSRTYDGSTDVAASNLSLDNLVSGEDLDLSGSGGMADKHAGSGKDLDVANLNVGDGTDGQASNYTFTGGSHTVDIDPATLTLTTDDVTKTYDGTTDADGTPTVDSGQLYDSDSLSDGDYAFADPDAGDNKTVTVDNITVSDGNSGGNYDVSYADNTTSTIDPRPLDVDGSRTYDGSTDVAASNLSLDNLVSGEDLVLSGSGGMADKHAGSGKDLNVANLNVGDGTDGQASNYTFTGGSHTVDIDPATLTLTTDDVTKTYDGTTDADGTPTVDSGQLYDSDSLSDGDYAFADPDAGDNKTVTVDNITVSDGNSGGNYDVSYADNTTSTIEPRTLSVTGDFAAADKTYDGTTDAAISEDNLELDSPVVGDDVALDPTAAFEQADAGDNIPVELTETSALKGGDIDNYILDLTGAPITTASIRGEQEVTETVSDISRQAIAEPELDTQDFELADVGPETGPGSTDTAEAGTDAEAAGAGPKEEGSETTLAQADNDSEGSGVGAEDTESGDEGSETEGEEERSELASSDEQEEDNQEEDEEDASEIGTETRRADTGALTNVEVIATGIRLPEFLDQEVQ